MHLRPLSRYTGKEGEEGEVKGGDGDGERGKVRER